MNDPTTLYKEKTGLLKALAHPPRLRIVRGLPKRSCRNVGCMEASTGQSQSCISRRLMHPKATRVVKAARSGNEVYYEITDPEMAAVLSALFGDREEGYQYTTSR